MDTKRKNLFVDKVRVFSLLLLVLSGCGCDEDMYGERLELSIPINTEIGNTPAHVGDTVWITTRFDKNVDVRNTTKTILLEDFNFFSKFVLSEISDTFENFNVELDVIHRTGEMLFFSQTTTVAYGLIYEETSHEYVLEVGFIIKTPGLMYGSFGSNRTNFEESEHPALYTCGNNHRDIVDVYYRNESSTRESYDSLFLKTNVDYLKEIRPFDVFQYRGEFVFEVLP